MTNPFRSRWDQLLDWWEFVALRRLKKVSRRWMAGLLVALAVFSVIRLAPAADAGEQYVLMPVAALVAIAQRIEELEAENTRLKQRCPPGAAAI